MGLIGMSLFSFKGCEQFVKDTNELYSGLAIPHAKECNCHYNEEKKYRLSLYTIKIDPEVYLSKNKFNQVPLQNFTGLRGFDQLKKDEFPESPILFEAQGRKWGNTWRYLYEKKTGRLWVEVHYY